MSIVCAVTPDRRAVLSGVSSRPEIKQLYAMFGNSTPPHTEPTNCFSSVTLEDCFSRNATRWQWNVSDLYQALPQDD